MSKISICIPAYRAERYLSEALESVRYQTFTDWELIVVEDGSKDEAERIVREFSASVAQPVHYLLHSNNRGLSAARNTGIRAAHSNWIALLDADDIWHYQHLEALFKTVEKSAPDIAFSGCRLFHSETNMTLGTREAEAETLNHIGSSLFQGAIVIQPSTVILSKQFTLNVGLFNENIRMCEDIEFWIRAARSHGRFDYTGTISCDYRKHAEAMSSKSAMLIEATGRVLLRHRDWNEVPRKLRRASISRQFLSAARMYARRRPVHAMRLCLEWALASITI